MKVSKMELKKFREMVGDKIFSVEFIKKDGSIREMTARFGVTKHLKGGELSYDPSKKGYMIVFDMSKKEYRTINMNTLKRVTFSGIEYIIE